jgi:hypothetical protein
MATSHSPSPPKPAESRGACPLPQINPSRLDSYTHDPGLLPWDITSENSQQGHEATTAWLSDDNGPRVLVGPGPRLGAGHPMRLPRHEVAWSQQESDAMSTYSYCWDYPHSASTLPSSLGENLACSDAAMQGSPFNLPPMVVRPKSPDQPYSHSETEYNLGYTSATQPYVKSADVNALSAGASDTKNWCPNARQNYPRLPSLPTGARVSPAIDRKEPQARARSGKQRSEPRNRRWCPISRPVPSTSRRGPAYAAETQRPFFCTFHFAGCRQTFATKNEWKRHVSAQHIQNKIWRCDFPSCSGRKSAIFNRKDLFGQHLKRMHAPAERSKAHRTGTARGQTAKQSPEMERFLNIEIQIIQTRCCKFKRELPVQSCCGFCNKQFQGPGSWEERMEHVGRHYENAVANGENVNVEDWKPDTCLIGWALRERLAIQRPDGTFSLVSVGKEAVMNSEN